MKLRFKITGMMEGDPANACDRLAYAFLENILKPGKIKLAEYSFKEKTLNPEKASDLWHVETEPIKD